MGILKEIFGQRIEMPDGSHADCLHPDYLKELQAQEAAEAAKEGDQDEPDKEDGESTVDTPRT